MPEYNIPHVNIFCMKTRLNRVSFASKSQQSTASGRGPGETFGASGRGLK